MKSINLPSGEKVIVDDDDYEWLSSYRWHICGGYADRNLSRTGNGGKIKVVLMHREILQRHGNLSGENDITVDHINRAKLDNRKSNLRIATQAQNNVNRIQGNNTSGCPNVFWSKSHRKWRVEISFNGSKVQGGLFNSLSDAVAKRNELAVRYYGNYALVVNHV